MDFIYEELISNIDGKLIVKRTVAGETRVAFDILLSILSPSIETELLEETM